LWINSSRYDCSKKKIKPYRPVGVSDALLILVEPIFER